MSVREEQVVHAHYSTTALLGNLSEMSRHQLEAVKQRFETASAQTCYEPETLFAFEQMAKIAQRYIDRYDKVDIAGFLRDQVEGS